MAFTYSKVADYIVGDLWGYQGVNAIKENIRYLVEDVMSLTGAETQLAGITLNHGATDGGTIYFNDGTADYIQCNAAGSTLSVASMYFRVKDIAHKGDYCVFDWWTKTSVSSNEYLVSSNSTYTCGVIVPRAGSIIGIGISAVSLGSNTWSCRGEAHVNGSNVFDSGNISFTASNQYRDAHATQAAGTDSVSAGDLIDFYIALVSGTSSTMNVSGWIMVEWD